MSRQEWKWIAEGQAEGLLLGMRLCYRIAPTWAAAVRWILRPLIEQAEDIIACRDGTMALPPASYRDPAPCCWVCGGTH
jgi:hypothetical protein